MADLSWGDDEADDLEQYGPPIARKPAPVVLGRAAEPIAAGQMISVNLAGGIVVTAHLNGNAPLPRQTSGENLLAAHRPTRYALIMRRQRANASRRARRMQEFPAILPGSCVTCNGLGVVDGDRRRCPICKGSGDR